MALKSSALRSSATDQPQDSERQPLLGSSSASSDYRAIPQSAPPVQRTRRSPYLTFFLRFYFAIGVVLLLPVTVMLILLFTNYFEPIPLLLPPHRSPAVLPFWFCLISVSMLAPGLLFFELASHATNFFHLFVLCCTVADVVLLLAVPEFRITHSYLGFASVGLCFLSTLWAFFSSHHLQKQKIPFTLNPDVGAPIVTQISLSRAQAKWTRRFKLVWALFGCLAVASAAALVTFDLVLDAADSGFKPLGNLTMVHPTSLTKDPVYPQDPANVNPYPVSFRLHLACESAPRQPDHLKSNNTDDFAPTALVMSERGVSGVIAAQFLREMVARSGARLGESDDGHLAITRVCFWDRIGYGHSDFVYQPTSVRLQTEALYKALQKHDEVDLSSSLKRGNNQKEDIALGKFMLVSTGYGNLFAHDFAIQHPKLIHSFLNIDAETPDSWYTDKVASDSGARAGYLARRHGSFGSLLYDLLPALAEPIGVTRIIGLLKGKSVIDRILAPGVRGRATRHNDMGGGGWRIYGAGGGNPRALMSNWLERLDANLGTLSPNFAALRKSRSEYQSLLSKRPVAVLSSFWRIHADVNGWGQEQRESLVAPAKNSSSLVGWWRVGDRKERAGGGDEGGPSGICSTKMGVIFCEEAVRKLIAAGQMWNGTVASSL
ncbi:uncharacterized protein MEPE_06488 [Melanopsichium pennsylvanicum]|uniref:Uncharacterized protein n=2 Tax=Melanopsichium pennsylvanicum TaxID=63383 RepID=A0AAJ4XTM0_9BASI|nr:conserved hypothetical protein [Melanopsichium pennsylvanicum 4]SNX87777.1 uncharacterized protein MEPE_06488 [Melanopsichium pennsylvanicum]